VTRRCHPRRRFGKIKREEFETPSPAAGANVLSFIRNYDQYIEEIRPNFTQDDVIGLQELFSDTINFVDRQVFHIFALHI
jgi:hypothetical protein